MSGRLPTKQNLFIPFGAGLQTDVDDKLLPLGKMLDLENCQFSRAGELTKRFGTKVLALPGGLNGQFSTHLQALLDTGIPAQTLATPASPWTAVPGDMRAGISAALTKVQGNVNCPDVCYGAGFYGVAYRYFPTPTTYGLQFVLIDAATGHRALSLSFNVSGGATLFSGWRVTYGAARFTLSFVDDAGAVRFVSINPATLAVAATVTVAGVGIATPTYSAFDATTRTAGTVVVVAFPDGAGNAKAIDFDPIALTTSTWTPKDAGAASIPLTTGACGWVQDAANAGKLALITESAGQGLKVQWDFPTAGATRQAAHTYVVDAAFTPDSPYVTGHTSGASALGDLVIVYGSHVGTLENLRVQSASFIAGALSTVGLNVCRGACLASKTCVILGEPYVFVTRFSPTNGATFLVHVPVSAQATATPLSAMGVRRTGANLFVTGFSGVAVPSNNTVAVGINYLAGTFIGGPNGVEIATVKFLPLQQGAPQSVVGSPLEAIDSAFVPGGMLAQFDGLTFAEAGFAYGPEQPATHTPGNPGGSMTPGATYWYQFVYRRIDAQGRVWRSKPSILQSVLMGGADVKVTWAIGTLRLSGRTTDTIEIYRGQPGDAQLLQLAGTVANDLTVDTVAFVDGMEDAALALQEELYTNGGVRANDTPPNFIDVTEASNRTWGISEDDPQVLWPSKEHDVGHGIEWSEAFAIDVRDNHGPMLSLAQLDGRAIIFKADAVYAVVGAGPDNLGRGGTLEGRIVCAGIGSANAQSVCETRDGIMFLSTSQRSGFFLLDRGLTVTPIGDPMQRYIGEVITSSVFLSSLLQARFFTQSGRTLVYDLPTKQWSTFTGQPCLTATSWNGIAAWTSYANLHSLVEDVTGTTKTDDGAAFEMKAGCPWVQINTLRGYERFWRAQLVGEVVGAPVTVSIDMYKDHETVLFATVSLVLPVGVIKGAELRYSKKLGAVRFVVRDNASTTGILKLTGITLVVGVKEGLARAATTSRMS